MDRLFTIKEVAKYLKVSERSVNRYIEADRLKAFKIGQWRVSQKDLERFLNRAKNIKK